MTSRKDNPLPGMEKTVSLVARRVIVTSAAYYGLDVSLVPDTTFDLWCKRLHDEWDDLDGLTQWKLGDPQSIRTSGFHCRLTEVDAGGLVSWLKQEKQYRWLINAPRHRETDKKIVKLYAPTGASSFRYMRASEFSWDKENPIQ